MLLRKASILSLGMSVFGLALTSAAPRAAADIALDAGSTVSVTSEGPDTISAVPVTNDVTALPYTTTTTGSTVPATVTPNLSTSALDFSFNIPLPAGPLTGGEYGAQCYGEIFFTPGANTTYTIAGNVSAVAAPSPGVLPPPMPANTTTLSTELKDLTSGTVAYLYDNLSAGSAASLDSSGGSLTGPLTSGDEYALDVSEQGASPNAETVSGSISVSFGPAVPEPASFGLLTAAGIGMLTRRRAAKSR